MIIINYLPAMIGAVVAAFIFGLIVRVASEGASFKTALRSPFRFLFIPIAIIIVIIGLHTNKRELIFQAKQSTKINEDIIRHMERILQSKRSLVWFLMRFCFAMYRPLMDAFIRATVQFEKKQAEVKERNAIRLPKYQKKRKEEDDKFFAYFLNDSDVKHHLFHVEK